MRDYWQVLPLGGLCDVLDHKRKPITKRDREAGEYPYYGATGVLDHVAGYLFDERLVLVGEDGAKWGSGENTAFAVEGKVWVNNHAHVLRPNRDKLLDRWLIYHLNHSDLAPFVSGLTVPKLNQGSLREIPVPVPPLSEQRRIVALLDEAFAGLATAKANAELNLRNARAIFDSHLQSVFGQRRQGWEQRALGDLCCIARGGSPRPIGEFLTTEPGGVNWIKISDATSSGKYIYRTAQAIRPEGAARSRMVNDGDFILSNSMSFGRPYIMRTSGCIHDGWLVLSDYSASLEQDYLYYVLGSQLVFRQFDRLAAGSTVRNLNIDLASRVVLPVPPLDIQRAIVQEVEALAEETQRLTRVYERKLAALEELKKSLLHQAFNGEL
jgi:type I restriction enzyme S subunit